jgi:hypothetical protein
VVSVLVAGAACGYGSILAIAQAAAGGDQEMLAALGVRRNPGTGAHEPPETPQVMSALTNLAITLFRIQAVTR